MKKTIVLFFTVLWALSSHGQTQVPHMEPLFNGEDLNQWKVPEDNMWWILENGTLWAKSDPGQKGSILWTKKNYTDFVVEMDFKFGTGTVDSGIFMRGDDERNAQIQIGESGSLKRDMTGSPYIVGMSYPVEAVGIKELLKPEDWNTNRAMAKGETYTVWLNGIEVMAYTLEGANLNGPIGLQLHPNRDMTIQFRDIKVASF